MASPDIATGLRYSDGQGSGGVFSTANLPRMVARVRDSDTAGSGLQVFMRMFNSAGRYLYKRAMTRTVTGGAGAYSTFEYQTINPGTFYNEIKRVILGMGTSGGTWQMRLNGILTEPIPVGIGPATVASYLGRHPDMGDASVVNVSYAVVGATVQFDIEFLLGRGRINMNQHSVVNNLKPAGRSLTSDTIQNGSGDFPYSTGEYYWDVVAFDGNTWSGGAGGYEDRVAVGPERMVLFMDIPTVGTSISPAPSATVTTMTPTLSWDFEVNSLGLVPIVKQVDEIYTTAGSFVERNIVDGTSPNNTYRSWKVPSNRLKHGQTYEWTHTVTKKSGLVEVWKRTFVVSLPRPAAIGFTATLSPDKAFMTLAWTPSALSGFQYYTAKVREAGVAATSDKNVTVDIVTERTTSSLKVWKFPFNTDFIVSFMQTALVSGQVVEGTPTDVAMRVNSDTIVIANVRSGNYVQIPYHVGRTTKWPHNPTRVHPWNRRAPVGVRGKKRSREMQVSSKLSSNGLIADLSRAQARKIEDLYFNEEFNALVWRDAAGNVIDALMNGPEFSWEGGGIIPVGEVSLFEVDAILQNASDLGVA